MRDVAQVIAIARVAPDAPCRGQDQDADATKSGPASAQAAVMVWARMRSEWGCLPAHLTTGRD